MVNVCKNTIFVAKKQDWKPVSILFIITTDYTLIKFNNPIAQGIIGFYWCPVKVSTLFLSSSYIVVPEWSRGGRGNSGYGGRVATGRSETYRTRCYRTVGDLQDVRCTHYRTLRYRTLASELQGTEKAYPLRGVIYWFRLSLFSA